MEKTNSVTIEGKKCRFHIIRVKCFCLDKSQEGKEGSMTIQTYMK